MSRRHKGSGCLCLVGLGLDPVAHLTLEGLQALAECDSVHLLGVEGPPPRGLARCLRRGAALRRWRVGETYGLPRRILAELESGRRVGVASLAHPFHWDAAAGTLVRRCERMGVPWTSFAAISPTALAVSQIGVSLGLEVMGLQCIDGSEFAAGNATADPNWPLLLHFRRKLAADESLRLVRRLESRISRPEFLLCSASGASVKIVPMRELAKVLRTASPVEVLCFGL